MKALDELVQDIATTYVAYHGHSSPLPSLCLYNGALLNGQFSLLGERLREALQARGFSPSSITLSKEGVPLPDHYAIDIEWFMQKYGVVLE